MSRFSQLYQSLMGAGAVAAVAAPVAAPAASTGDIFADLDISDDQKAQLTADVTAVLTQAAGGEAKGFKAGTDRAVQVMTSDKGKANPAMALALLGNEKLAALTADEIQASLPDAPAAGAAAAEPPKGDEEQGGRPKGAAEAEKRLAATPQLALGNRGNASGELDDTGDGKAKGEKKQAALGAWGNAQGKNVTKGGVGALATAQ